MGGGGNERGVTIFFVSLAKLGQKFWWNPDWKVFFSSLAASCQRGVNPGAYIYGVVIRSEGRGNGQENFSHIHFWRLGEGEQSFWDKCKSPHKVCKFNLSARAIRAKVNSRAAGSKNYRKKFKQHVQRPVQKCTGSEYPNIVQYSAVWGKRKKTKCVCAFWPQEMYICVSSYPVEDTRSSLCLHI